MNKIYPKRTAAVEAAERRAMLERKKKSEEKQKMAMTPLFGAFPSSKADELVVCVGAKLFKVTELLLVLDRLVDDGFIKAGESVHSALRRMNKAFIEMKELPKGE